MLLRNALLAALVAAPLAINPAPASAQSRATGPERAEEVRTTNPGRVPQEMPPGMERRLAEGAEAPEGIVRTRGGLLAPTETETDPGSDDGSGEDEFCVTEIVVIFGIPTTRCVDG